MQLGAWLDLRPQNQQLIVQTLVPISSKSLILSLDLSLATFLSFNRNSSPLLVTWCRWLSWFSRLSVILTTFSQPRDLEEIQNWHRESRFPIFFYLRHFVMRRKGRMKRMNIGMNAMVRRTTQIRARRAINNATGNSIHVMSALQ